MQREMEKEPLLAAVVQMTSTADVLGNLERAAGLVERAARRGARLVVLPENFALLSTDETEKFRYAVRLDGTVHCDGEVDILSEMRGLSQRLGVHLILGGLPERAKGGERVYNSCLHVRPGPAGVAEVAAVYRKIHLFDVDFGAANTGGTLRESDTVEPGDPEQAVVTETPCGPVGLSVCYDLRFPELYRRLVQRGAKILVVPAAFTLHTGKDHWHVLLRARAIENQCFVLAAAQQGRHSDKRLTYGHSLIVDPWGTVLAECPDGEGMTMAEVDFSTQERVRSQLPCLGHRRLSC
jgi:predicted amidohydrolase